MPNTLFFRSTQSNETVCRRRPDSQATEYPDSPMSQDSAKNSQSQSSRCKDKVGRKQEHNQEESPNHTLVGHGPNLH